MDGVLTRVCHLFLPHKGRIFTLGVSLWAGPQLRCLSDAALRLGGELLEELGAWAASWRSWRAGRRLAASGWAPRFSRRRLMWPLRVALLRGLRLHAIPRSAPRAGKRLCGLDKALSARRLPSTDVETVGLVKVLVVLHNSS